MRPFWLLLICALLLIACAQVGEITGGEKDITPPKLVSADPPDQSTYFTGKRITLVFNERIQLERVRERLLISPPLPTYPVVRLVGPRSVVIELNSPLQPNTTYSFTIGEAVTDLTEGNPAAGVSYVLSTGAFVDSLMIAGRVINAFSGVAEKDVLVMVYDADDTASIRTSRPAYATRSDAQGLYTLKHLRTANYRLYALRDKNANYKYDLPNEEIAFLLDSVPAAAADSLAIGYELRLFQEPSPLQRLKESKVMADGAFRLLFERPAERATILDIARTGSVLEWLPEWSTTRDTLHFWPSDTTALATGQYQISTEEGIIDTLRYRRIEKMPFFTSIQAGLIELEEGPSIRLRTSRPIRSIDSTRFELLQDSLPLKLSFDRDTTDLRRMHINAPINEGAQVSLKVMPKGVTDIYGGHNDTLIVGLGRAAEQSTGTLRIKVEMKEKEKSNGPFLLQLMDRQGLVEREKAMATLAGTVVWERLMPGEVNMRLIEDRNDNGRWDPGMLDARSLPETVWRYPEGVNVRAAWDLGVDWVIGPVLPTDTLDTEP